MRLMLSVMLAVSGAVTAGVSAAQSNYPTKPVRIIVNFS